MLVQTYGSVSVPVPPVTSCHWYVVPVMLPSASVATRAAVRLPPSAAVPLTVTPLVLVASLSTLSGSGSGLPPPAAAPTKARPSPSPAHSKPRPSDESSPAAAPALEASLWVWLPDGACANWPRLCADAFSCAGADRSRCVNHCDSSTKPSISSAPSSSGTSTTRPFAPFLTTTPSGACPLASSIKPSCMSGTHLSEPSLDSARTLRAAPGI